MKRAICFLLSFNFSIRASCDGNSIFLGCEFLGFISDSTLMTFLLFLITSAFPLLDNLTPAFLPLPCGAYSHGLAGVPILSMMLENVKFH